MAITGVPWLHDATAATQPPEGVRRAGWPWMLAAGLLVSGMLSLAVARRLAAVEAEVPLAVADAVALGLVGCGLFVVAAAGLAAHAWERWSGAAAAPNAAFQPTSIQGQPVAASATMTSVDAQPSVPASA